MRGANQGFVAALRGPVIMITIGVLFLLDKFTPFQFGQTWPVILIVLGALALAGGSGKQLPPSPGDPSIVGSGLPPDARQSPPGVRR